MKSLLDLFRKPKSASSFPVQGNPACNPDDEEIPRYPPFAKGLPAASVDRVLASQSELVGSIRHTLGLPNATFNSVVMPVIARYAAFTHLLPASEAHHHRGAGGLFRHGLEVAYWAALASEGVVFGVGTTPVERKSQEPRWRLAVCLAGLLHDIGKPVSDLSILDREGNTQWNPYLENLTEWAEKNSVDRYFLRWRDKRHQRHGQFSVLVAERVLTAECLSHLTLPGPEIMQAMLEAIAGVDRGSVFHHLVLNADQQSVERDLKANHIPVDASLGVPVEKYLLDAMRRLISQGQWTANTRGSRVWHFKDGLHVVWRAGAQEVTELLARDRIPGIPRDPDTLADILIERGLALPRQDGEGRAYRYWRMAPSGMDVALYMLRLSSPELVYNGEPPVVVEGRLLDDADQGNALSREDSQPSAPTPEADQEPANPKPAERSVQPTPAEKGQGRHLPVTPTVCDSPITPAKADHEAQGGQSHAQSEQAEGGAGRSTAIPARPGQDKAPAELAPRRPQASLLEQPKPERHSPDPGRKPGKPVDVGQTRVEASRAGDGDVAEKSGINDAEPPSEILPASNDNHNPARIKAENWLASQGPAGEWLRESIAANQTPPVVPVRVIDGLVFIPHPDMAQKLGKNPRESLELMDGAGLIEADIRTPLRKVREIDNTRGLMLNREASLCWLAMVGDLVIPLGTAGSPSVAADRQKSVPAATQPGSTGQAQAPAKELGPSAVQAAGQQPKKNGNAGSAKPAPGKPLAPAKPTPSGAGRPDEPAKPANPATAITLERMPEIDICSADDLIRRIRERDGLPCPLEETGEWLSVPYSILDWYAGQSAGMTRSKLIVSLHRHPDVQLEGSRVLKIRKASE